MSKITEIARGIDSNRSLIRNLISTWIGIRKENIQSVKYLTRNQSCNDNPFTGVISQNESIRIRNPCVFKSSQILANCKVRIFQTFWNCWICCQFVLRHWQFLDCLLTAEMTRKLLRKQAYSCSAKLNLLISWLSRQSSARV